MRLFIYEFLCAGGLGPAAPQSLRREGWAMLSAIADDFARVPGMHVTTLVDGNCPQPPGHECHRLAGGEPAALRACAARADATLVIAPEFDDCLLERSRWVLEAGGRLLGSQPAAVARTADKLALARHWQAHRVRTPATALATAVPPSAWSAPWVCKPRFGAGAQATFLVSTTEAWEATYYEAQRESPRGGLLAQTFMPGVAASVAFLLGPGRCVPLLPAAQHLSCAGRLRYRGGELPLPNGLRNRAMQLGRAALEGVEGLEGYVGVNLVLGTATDGTEDYAVEVNARLTTSYVGLRRLCRGNLAQAWLEVLAGRDPDLAWEERHVRFSADGTVCEQVSEHSGTP